MFIINNYVTKIYHITAIEIAFPSVLRSVCNVLITINYVTKIRHNIIEMRLVVQYKLT